MGNIFICEEILLYLNVNILTVPQNKSVVFWKMKNGHFLTDLHFHKNKKWIIKLYSKDIYMYFFLGIEHKNRPSFSLKYHISPYISENICTQNLEISLHLGLIHNALRVCFWRWYKVSYIDLGKMQGSTLHCNIYQKWKYG